MSASRAAALRSFNGILQSPSLSPSPRCLSIRPIRARRSQVGALLVADAIQRRQQSSSSGKNAKEQKPPIPSSKLMLRALRQSLTFRPLFSAFRGQSLKNLFRQSPEELVLAIVLLMGVAGVSVYAFYAYFNYFQSAQFTRFPPHIAKSLRRALYYSNYAPDPRLAMKYYKLALEQCTESGLDPFSDEMMGLKIQLAAWLEKVGSYQNSIDVLEALLRDSKKWVEVMEKSVQDGLIDNSGRLVGQSTPQKPAATLEAASKAQEETEPEPENLWAKRTRVLGKSVGISVKLGELYADEHVLQGDSAGERLVWAVETVLKELQRRQVDGVKEDEGDWMSPEQIGGALEALGNHYESKSQHYLAAPLYLQAISLSPPNSCHSAVLMNNLAISLAQQPVESPIETPQLPGQGPTRSTLLASARSWALQAQGTAQKVQGENRTEECDEACAVALCNLGDIAAMAGDNEEAKRRFKESIALSKKIAFEPGTAQAQEGLKRISSPASKTSL